MPKRICLATLLLSFCVPAYAAATLSAVVSDDDMNVGKRKAVLSLSGHSGTWRLCLPGVTGNGRTMSETGTFTDRELDPATTYIYKAKGLGTSACEAASNVIASATVEALPAISFKRAYESVESIVLIWTELAGTNIQYKIGHKLSSASTYGTSRTVIDDGVFTIEPLSSGTYDVRLRAEDSSGSWLTRWSYLTDVVVRPRQVTGLTVTKTGTGTFRATWSAVSGVDSYDLIWKGLGEDVTERTESITSGTSFEKSGLTGHAYSVKVRAVKGTGSNKIEGEYSNEVRVDVREPLGKATISEIESSEAGRFTVNWNAVTDATAYEVSWRGLGLYDTRKRGKGISAPTSTYTTPVSDKLTGYLYAVKVRAGGAGDTRGPWSDEVRVDVCTLRNHNDATKCGVNLNDDGTPKTMGLVANRPETLGWRTFNHKVLLAVRPFPRPVGDSSAPECLSGGSGRAAGCPHYNLRYIGKKAPKGLDAANGPDLTSCAAFGDGYTRNVSDTSDPTPHATWVYEAREESCDGRLLNRLEFKPSTPAMIVTSTKSLSLNEGEEAEIEISLGVDPGPIRLKDPRPSGNDNDVNIGVRLPDYLRLPSACGSCSYDITFSFNTPSKPWNKRQTLKVIAKYDDGNNPDRANGKIVLESINPCSTPTSLCATRSLNWEYFRNGGPYEIAAVVKDVPLPYATVEGISAATVEGGDISFRVSLSPRENVASDVTVGVAFASERLNDVAPHTETAITCPADLGVTGLAVPDFPSASSKSVIVPRVDLRAPLTVGTEDDATDEYCGKVKATIAADDAVPPTYLVGTSTAPTVFVIDNDGLTAPPACPTDITTGTYPDCVCKDTNKTWDGAMCVTPPQCPAEATGTHPNCVCPSGKTYDQTNNACEDDTTNPPPACPAGQHEHDGRQCHVNTDPDHCHDGQHKHDAYACHPPGQSHGGGPGGGSGGGGGASVAVGDSIGVEVLDVGETKTIELGVRDSKYFRDARQYDSIASTDEDVLTAAIGKYTGRMTLTGLAHGEAKVTVVARGGGGTARQTFGVKVGYLVSVEESTYLKEGDSASVEVTINRTRDEDTVVDYRVVAPEDDGADYDDHGLRDGFVIIPANGDTATIEVSISDDEDIEPVEERFELVPLPGNWFGVGNSATVTVQEGVCDRTDAIGDRIRAYQRRVDCHEVANDRLNAIRYLTASQRGLAALKAKDLLGLASLVSVNLSGNRLREIPDGFFIGLTRELRTLRLNDNPGAPFLFLVDLERTDAPTTAPGPATVVATLPQAAPFNIEVDMLLSGGEASVDKVVIPAGRDSSLPFTVTGGGGTKLSMEVPSMPGDFRGVAMAVGELTLFKPPPERVDVPPERLRVALASDGDTARLDLSGLFRASDGGPLTYRVLYDGELVTAVVDANHLVVTSSLGGNEGIATVTVVAVDVDGLESPPLDVAVKVEFIGLKFLRSWKAALFAAQVE